MGRQDPALRKRPRGDAGRQIVESVLDAAALLLDRAGIEGMTTNAVARVAGVSVGSLYQYFPDKHAIVAELARRTEQAALELLARESTRLGDARTTASRVISYSTSPAFGTARERRALLREVPRGWTLEETRATDSTIGAALVAHFSSCGAEVRALDWPRAIFVLQHAVEGMIEAVLLAAPETLAGAAVKRELFHFAWAPIAAADAPLARPAVEDDLPSPAAPNPELVSRLVAERTPRTERQCRPSERALATRDAIVRAAERVLARDGFEKLSVRPIVEEAGVAIGALYRHFPNAQAVIAEVACQPEARACEDLARRLETASDPRSVAEAVASAYANDSHASPELRRALLCQVPRRWTEERSMSVQRRAIARLADAVEQAAARAGDRTLMAFMALHAAKSATEGYFLLEPNMTLAAVREELRDAIERYLTRPLG